MQNDSHHHAIPTSLRARLGGLDLSGPPAVMGILNVTPDSFSDGGRYVTVEAASERASRMIAEGAAVIDVGPESTRPGARSVPADEQIRRAAPVIAAIRGEHPCIPISIDTRSAQVAEAALAAGADIINDVSALRDDSEMASLAARTGAGLILMHMRGDPVTMQIDPRYADVVVEVRDFLAERARFAASRGVDAARIVVDPGIGFGKSVDHNLALLRGLPELVALGYPVLVGLSRKRVVRHFVGDDADSLLAGSCACALSAVMSGAMIVRAHDVGATVEWMRAAGAAIPPRSPALPPAGRERGPAVVCGSPEGTPRTDARPA